jgi:hypothetical protein
MTVDPSRIICRDEARALGLKRYFTGAPCKRGHVAERYVSSCRCMECDRVLALEWRVANLEKAREKGAGGCLQVPSREPGKGSGEKAQMARG